MNKFLKKRNNEAPAAIDDAQNGLSSSGQLSPGLRKPSTSRWKKSKKPQPEVKPEVNFSIELPSSDDFRTSLIMPNLSARFSMLREQDDPKSKLGKASDDSVLQPRRRSRMMEFGFGMGGLDDIAEVSSIHGSIKPPFARRSREVSYTSEDGYGSEADAATGNIMGRSRPGEGNNLFGGRQKVYKIAATGASSTRSLGKQVYEDDLGRSAFQKYRQKEREFDESEFSRPSDESQAFDFGLGQAEPGDQDDSAYDTLPMDSAKDLSHSPSLPSYDKKRSTTSSTARSDARSSTAATSVASQPSTSAAVSPAHAPASMVAPAMSASSSQDRNPKNRTGRLYDQGLDLHMQEQQTSALTRLNSLQQQRTYGGSKPSPYLHGTKSATNLRDRVAQPVYALRSQSPTRSAPALPRLNTLGSLRNKQAGSPSPIHSGPQSPMDDESDALTQALEPADRGKATAMGAFNKPAHAFDEQQYLERQQQLQRTNSTAVSKSKAAQQSAVQQRIDRYEHEGTRTTTTPSPDLLSRMRSNSAPRKHEPTRAYNVFQNAVNQFPAKSQSSAPKSSASDTHRTFFGDISASEDEDEEEGTHIAHSFNQPEYGYGTNNANKWQPSILHPVSEHPALRNQRSNPGIVEESEEPEIQELEPVASSRTLRADGPVLELPLDSPTLGPQTAEPLNGMMRHLRQKSNQSSVYPMDDLVVPGEEVPDVPDMQPTSKKSDSFSRLLVSSLETPESMRESVYSVSNPWDLDEARSSVGIYRSDVSPTVPNSNFYSTTQSIQSEASLASDGFSTRPVIGGRAESEISQVQDDLPSWQQELRKQHTRDVSTATQQERDAFETELAARRNAIQESIKGKVEQKNQSRGTSPAPSAASGGLRAFGMLRGKTSRDSLVNTPRDTPQKAGKPFGAGIVNPSSTSLHSAAERDGYSTESVRSGADASRVPYPTAQHPALKQDGQDGDGEAAKYERQLASSRPPLYSNGRHRSRSNSTTTGRSRSRTGPYRDDLEKAMAEGTGSSAAAHSPSVDNSTDVDGDLGNRESSGSKKNYFDAKSALAYQQNYQQATTRVGNGVVSPMVVAPNGFPPNRSSPPMSGSSPAIGAGHIPIIPTNAVRPGQMHRKKTISKSDISEPTLISSTSNVDTVDLPEGASLKNGMDEPPPLPPMNPRRRGTRKLFGLGRADSNDDVPKASPPQQEYAHSKAPPVRTSPPRDYQFPPSNVVRMPAASQSPPSLQSANTFSPASQRSADTFSPIMRQKAHAFSPTGSPERVQRPANARVEGGMF